MDVGQKTASVPKQELNIDDTATDDQPVSRGCVTDTSHNWLYKYLTLAVLSTLVISVTIHIIVCVKPHVRTCGKTTPSTLLTRRKRRKKRKRKRITEVIEESSSSDCSI